MIIGAVLVSLVMGLGAMCFAAPNPRALSFGISKRGGGGWGEGLELVWYLDSADQFTQGSTVFPNSTPPFAMVQA